MTKTILAVVAAGALSSGCIGGCGETYSVGERSGTVWKFSHKGLAWKSWEGELNLGGAAVAEGGVMVPNVWRFSTRNPAVAKQLEAAQTSGKRVTVSYRQWFVKPWAISTSYELTGVR